MSIEKSKGSTTMNTHIPCWSRQFFLLCVLWFAQSHAQAQSSQTTGGWFLRGTGTNFTYYSMVIPLDGQQGVTNAPSLAGITYTQLGVTNLYHLNATNTGAQNNLTNRIAISN